MNLQELGEKWHTAKVMLPGNSLSHDYAPTYEHLLAGKDVRNILEIGLGRAGTVHADQVAGNSLRMWAERFPEARVVGLDHDPNTFVNEGRIKSILCDQSNVDSLCDAAALLSGCLFDLIVDDASHIAQYQANTALIFAPLLARSGVYVIEDVCPGDECSRLLAEFGVPHQTIELRIERVEDDRLIIIRGEDL